MSVDLPEPDGPITAVSSPSCTLTDDAAERVDGRVTGAVAPRHVLRDDDGAVLPRLCGHGLRLCHVIASSSVSCGKGHGTVTQNAIRVTVPFALTRKGLGSGRGAPAAYAASTTCAATPRRALRRGSRRSRPSRSRPPRAAARSARPGHLGRPGGRGGRLRTADRRESRGAASRTRHRRRSARVSSSLTSSTA